MPFFKRSRSASSSSSISSQRSVSPLGASRYEQSYTPSIPQRRTPPNRALNAPENLLVAGYDFSNTCRRTPPNRTLCGPENLATPAQDVSSLGGWFEPKAPQILTRNRPQTSHLHGKGPKNPGLATRTGLPVLITNEEPDFSKAPVTMHELDVYGNHAPLLMINPERRKGSTTIRFSVGRSVMRTGPERLVRVVDAEVIERLLPGRHN